MISLISLYCLNRKRKLVCISVDIGVDVETEEKRRRNDEIVLIILITIFLLLFYARNLTVFLVLLTSELIIGIFWLIKRRWVKW